MKIKMRRRESAGRGVEADARAAQFLSAVRSAAGRQRTYIRLPAVSIDEVNILSHSTGKIAIPILETLQ